MTDYCEAAPGHPLHGPYHDLEYGFPVSDDRILFERLVLEINQAGLSWELMLRKREAFRSAFANYDLGRVARFDDRDRARLLGDAGIIRNRLKIDAVIENARRLAALRAEHGTFAAWLAEQHPLAKPDWVKLFRRQFKFMGGEIVGEFLMSTGYLPGAHRSDCPVYTRILESRPPWMDAPAELYEPG